MSMSQKYLLLVPEIVQADMFLLKKNYKMINKVKYKTDNDDDNV